MANPDLDALKRVIEDYSRARCDLSVTQVLNYLRLLVQVHREEFTIERASDALTNLAEDAIAIRDDLWRILDGRPYPNPNIPGKHSPLCKFASKRSDKPDPECGWSCADFLKATPKTMNLLLKEGRQGG